MRMGWIPMILGLWLIVAPFLLRYSNVRNAFWNDIIIGAIIAITSWVALTQAGRERARS